MGGGVLDSDCAYRESELRGSAELRLLDKNTGDHRDIQKKMAVGHGCFRNVKIYIVASSSRDISWRRRLLWKPTRRWASLVFRLKAPFF